MTTSTATAPAEPVTEPIPTVPAASTAPRWTALVHATATGRRPRRRPAARRANDLGRWRQEALVACATAALAVFAAAQVLGAAYWAARVLGTP